MKHFALILFLGVFLSIFVKKSYQFSECRGSKLADPDINGVTNCMSWATYLQSIGDSFTARCTENPDLASKCCFTCNAFQRFNQYCNDSAYIPDCQVKAQNNQCKLVLSTGLPVSFYCPKSCNVCGATVGPSCSVLENICGLNGDCLETNIFGVSTFRCVCKTGYYGADCSRTSVCISIVTNPCKNGATCVDSNDEDILYTCNNCPNGCGGKNCDVCNCLAGGQYKCGNGGECEGGVCNCASGFTGPFCDTPSTACTITSCLNGGTCNLETRQCICSTLYTGAFCQTFLGCTLGGTFLCQNGGTCQTDGKCTCLLGYGGSYCQSFIGCLAGGQYSCLNGGVCKTENGIGICQCPEGFSGTYCNTAIGCNSNGFSCLNGGICVSSTGLCNCLPTHTGLRCEIALIGCLLTPCQNGGTCNTNNGQCTCSSSYTGAFCQTFLGCLLGGQYSCQNGGICSANGECRCTIGYSGSFCQTFIGCVAGGQYSCLNGGVCKNDNGVGVCQCNSGWSGTFCERAVGCVGSNTCLNGGICQNVVNGFLCVCPSGFSGSKCEISNVCTNSPCRNGATCLIDSANKPFCKCAAGFYGVSCESLSPCASNPCKNNGICSIQATSETGYFCSCPANYFGFNCQVQLTIQTCRNGDTSSILCPIWASGNFCSYKFLYEFIPVPIYCPISCGLCDRLETCIDTQNSCEFWAINGLCEYVNNINPNACRKSCNNCPLRKRR